MIPTDGKEQAIYHTILSDLHRLRAMMLNLQTIDDPDTARSLQEHFQREQNLSLARLTEWRQRRPSIYKQASADFENQVRRD
jgi:hypothetical protein